RDRPVDVRDAAIAAAALRDRIEDDPVVRAVAARVHEHRALEAERFLELDETLERRVRRRIRAIWRVRILVARPEYVAVRVARLRLSLVLRRHRVRIGRPADRDLAGLAHFAASWRHFSRRSSVRIAGSTCATLAFGSRFSRIAAMNSRSCSSMPFIDTATPERSICLSLPSKRSS